KSTNGTFLNDSEQRIPREHTVPLGNGDRFILGEYEIEATMVAAEEGDEAVEAAGPVTDIVLRPSVTPADSNIPERKTLSPIASSLDIVSPPFSERKTPSPIASSLDIVSPPFNDLLAESRDSLGLGHSTPELRAPSGVATEPPLDVGGPEGAAYEPPDLLSPEPPPLEETPTPPDEEPATPLLSSRQEMPEELFSPEPASPAEPEVLLIPDDWWQASPVSSPTPEPPIASPFAEPVALRSAPVAPPPTPLPAPPVVAPPGLDTSALLRAFLDGAGLPQMRLNDDQLPEIMANLGAMFRETVRGLMDILLARGDLKGEFRLDRTAIGPLENNPLKTPPGQPPLRVEEVMTLLLISQKGAYMSPVQAVQESFHDIKAHQLAVVAGIQAALTRLLERFDPDHLEARLGQSVLDNIWPANRKAKYWDLFNAEYQAIAREAEDDFNELFGDEFVRAYEERLRSE
ncbi:MAG: type VI secretion system-associated FHA domain protein TagH, partial [Candidatus Competibacteraceae bacterium]|nr:type VI secretion system-associated FHA domain protein TagH [Candidatus Competibacteraceae bacterium]